MKKVLVIDTSILCVWLEVPGKGTCGPDNDRWDKQRVDKKIQDEAKKGTLFVLPLATIIETGNHIAQSAHSRMERGKALVDLIIKSVDEQTPWAAFFRTIHSMVSGKNESIGQHMAGSCIQEVVPW